MQKEQRCPVSTVGVTRKETEEVCRKPFVITQKKSEGGIGEYASNREENILETDVKSRTGQGREINTISKPERT